MAPAVSLPYLMSRFLALGVPFEDVLTMVTTTPAAKMGMADAIGCLKPGARANVAVWNLQKGNFNFTDVKNSTITGTELLVPLMTVLEGELVYRDYANL